MDKTGTARPSLVGRRTGSEAAATPRRGVGPGRAWAIAWATERVTDPKVLYLDTETTGLDGRAEIVDIAVADGAGKIVFETLVRPDMPIPRGASAIHGIEDSHVADAPTWPEIHDDLSRLLADRVVVVYNAPFDHRMLSQSSARHGVAEPNAVWTCAMTAYAAFREVAAGRGGYRRHKLEHAAASFGGTPGGHRAAGDALACRAVVLGIASSLPLSAWAGT